MVKPLLAGQSRLTLALDDTPTPRYGPQVQGAGVHHNPTPGPAGSPYLYGHVFVVLGLLLRHKAWGTIVLPLLARLSVRKVDLPAIDPKHRPEYRIKLELAVELLRWAKSWLGSLKVPIRVVAEGPYAKADFLPGPKPGPAQPGRASREASGLDLRGVHAVRGHHRQEDQDVPGDLASGGGVIRVVRVVRVDEPNG